MCRRTIYSMYPRLFDLYAYLILSEFPATITPLTVDKYFREMERRQPISKKKGRQTSVIRLCFALSARKFLILV